MLFRNALSMLTIRGEIRRLEHTQQPSDVRRTTIDVPLATAMLGGEAHVVTPDGRKLALRIPPETANGKSFRLRGQGMPHLGQPERRRGNNVSVPLARHPGDHLMSDPAATVFVIDDDPSVRKALRRRRRGRR